jgi:hypothetical protein
MLRFVVGVWTGVWQNCGQVACFYTSSFLLRFSVCKTRLFTQRFLTVFSEFFHIKFSLASSVINQLYTLSTPLSTMSTNSLNIN